MARSALERSLVGPAGEHFVMYQVHMRGQLAALAPRNLPQADLMVVASDGSTSALVQVKPRTRGADGGWHMRDKHKELVLPRLFYCFVDFEPQAPITYIRPRRVVSTVVPHSHRARVP